ncbi:uncharacterized protein PAC_19716 [Phialocephala subalpina]|uniref:Uncharacterized protein n=1 Tax=Phialocephala subalpina TaxID=576137 RepID=A0A1L7XXV7_9HELO|nr:uncharacterized protein PAC_19716 [Phialocephala subalpina]
MGSTCSGLRRQRPRTRQEDGKQSAPPPYEPGRRTTSIIDELDKEEPPSLSAHPALRDRWTLDRISTSSLRTATTDSSPSVSTSGRFLPQIPEQAHHELHTPGSHSLRRLSVTTPPPLPLDEIVASTTPLWRWNNAQCQTWIAAVLIQYAGKSQDEAKILASGFKGWGPNLYMKEWKQWNAWLGQDGQAIFALLMEVHGKEGAVPTTVEIAHYTLEDKKRAERERRSRREGEKAAKERRA